MKIERAIIKSTLIIVIAVLVMRKLVTYVINFRTMNSNIISLISNAVDGCLRSTADNYLNRRYFTIRSDDIIYETISSKPISRSVGEGEKLRHCVQQTQLVLLRRYEKEDVVRCLDSLWVQKHNQLIFAFVGDSTVRQHYTNFIRLIPDYDWKTKSRFNTKTIQQLYHDDMNVTSHLLANLKLSFYLRNLINEDLLSLFKRWASTENHTQVPDFILFGATAHHLLPKHNFSFETYQTLLENELVPLMKKSLAVHPHQEIIWLKPSHTVEFHADSSARFYHDRIKKYADILPRVLKDTRVVIWDAINALAEEYIRGCILTRYDRQDMYRFENCNDLIHTGGSAISIGTPLERLLLNHLCGSR